MPIRLYELVGVDDRRFSPFCWRIRMALAHKQIEVETVPTRFTEIADIPNTPSKRVPVIDDSGFVINDSWAIAKYLDETYPNQPSLFGGQAGLSLSVLRTLGGRGPQSRHV